MGFYNASGSLKKASLYTQIQTPDSQPGVLFLVVEALLGNEWLSTAYNVPKRPGEAEDFHGGYLRRTTSIRTDNIRNI